MSPRTWLIPLAGALALLTACGEPPEPLPTSPPYTAPSASIPAISIAPSLPPVVTQPVPTLATTPVIPAPAPTYATLPPPPTVTATTTAPTTKSPTPTPSHAARCTGEPTGAQILTLIKDPPYVPAGVTPRVDAGPYCSGTWSFTTVELAGRSEDEVEPLMVVATGTGTTLTLITAGSDVCIDRVQSDAPAGIRVLACGF